MRARDVNALAKMLWLASAAVLSVAVGIRIWRLTTATAPWDVVNLVQDDAYYYLTMAANTVESGRSTVDGSTLTNGYQPLWFILVTLLGLVIGTEAMRYFAGFILMTCVIALIGILWGIPLRKSADPVKRAALAVGLSLTAVLWSKVFLAGMEVVLLLPVAIPLICLLERKPDRRTVIYLSGVLAILFLIRIDTLALVPAYVLIVFLIEPWLAHRRADFTNAISQKQIWRNLMWLPCILVPVVLTYAGINFAVYDTALPVSGQTKSIGRKFANFDVFVGYAHALRWLVPFILIGAVIEALAIRRGVRSKLFLRSMAVCTVAGALHAIYYAFASTWMLWDWYFYYVAFLMILISARVVVLGTELWRQGSRLSSVSALAGILAIVAGSLFLDVHKTFVSPSPPPLPPIGENTLLASGRVLTYNEISLLMLRDFFSSPQAGSTLIAMGDRAGGLAYWGRSSVRIVHTEGLLLGHAYIEARRRGTAQQYLTEYPGIEYFVLDRDWVPTVERADGSLIYVVADPIQAIPTDSSYRVAVFCFPQSAIRLHQRYERYNGPSQRIAFAFDKRVPCSDNESSVISDAIAKSELRRMSVPNEYR